MTSQYVFGATAVVFALGVVTVEPSYAQQRRDGNLLPQEQGGQVTAVGCLLRGSDVRGGKKDKDKYVLARPRKGPVASVPEASCTADPGADALDLDNTKDAGVTDSLLGRWVEIGGRLEKETGKNPDNLRELDVKSFKAVPVVVPRAAAAPTTPPRAAAAAAPTSPPVASTSPAPEATAASAAPAQAASESASHGKQPSGDWIGRVARACRSLHSSFVPSPATRLIAADTDCDRGHDSSRCCALRRNPLTRPFGAEDLASVPQGAPRPGHAVRGGGLLWVHVRSRFGYHPAWIMAGVAIVGEPAPPARPARPARPAPPAHLPDPPHLPQYPSPCQLPQSVLISGGLMAGIPGGVS